MKILLLLFNSLFTTLLLAQDINKIQTESLLRNDSIKSALDGNTQIFYYSKSANSGPQPLVVQLHSWSYTADSLKTIGLDVESYAKGYNYIFPNFRGINNHPKACCSEYVIQDIDESIDWALKNMNVDKKRIFIVGYSGGGMATLAMYMKSRHTIRAFSAWVPISDLVAWYGQSKERRNRYANEIINCIGASETFDTAKAIERSPLFWATPKKKRKKSTMQIFAGIHDGYTGPVPISQSILFYNKLLSDFKEKDSSKYVTNSDMQLMLKTQSFSTPGNKKIGNRTILYQKTTKKIMLTIFEGGHDLLSKESLEYIEQMNSHH
jgi:predicted peptidase